MTHADAPPLALTIRLFALLRDQLGQDVVDVEVPAGTTVADLVHAIRKQEPRLAPFLEVSRVAVNLAFAPKDRVLEAGDEVALIPPVGGG